MLPEGINNQSFKFQDSAISGEVSSITSVENVAIATVRYTPRTLRSQQASDIPVDQTQYGAPGYALDVQAVRQINAEMAFMSCTPSFLGL